VGARKILKAVLEESFLIVAVKGWLDGGLFCLNLPNNIDHWIDVKRRRASFLPLFCSVHGLEYTG
jgi:hypothetical protein